MNKKGQTLIVFVLLLPIFILLLAFVVDTGLILQESTRLNSTTTTILKTTYQDRNSPDYQENIKDLYQKNNIPTEHMQLETKENQITLKNNYTVESIFGKIIGIQEYKIATKRIATLENETIKITKE